MNPQPLFCPNIDCPSRGRQNAGNLTVHDSLKDRFRCRDCQTTFSVRKGTLFYRLKTDPQTVICVLVLLAFGCPVPAVVRAFRLDERTVRSWQTKAGRHCEQVHTHLVTEQPRHRPQVQADEIRVRCQKRIVWMAMALCVQTRLWLGGVVSPQRDKHLARSLADRVKACCLPGALLVVTDGFPAYKAAFARAFRQAKQTGKRGRPALTACTGFVLAQTVKWQEAGRCLGIRVCHLLGDCAGIARLLPAGQVLNTAYIERLNATFRQRLAGFCRRSRCLLRHETSVADGMFLVGTVYNFCTPHQSLTKDKQLRTPAMAAGLTDYVWSVGELLGYRIAPAPYVPPQRRGRPPENGAKAGAQQSKGGNAVVTV